MTDIVEQPLADGGVTHVKIPWAPWYPYDLFQEVPAFGMWMCWCCIFLFHVRLHPEKEKLIYIYIHFYFSYTQKKRTHFDMQKKLYYPWLTHHYFKQLSHFIKLNIPYFLFFITPKVISPLYFQFSNWRRYPNSLKTVFSSWICILIQTPFSGYMLFVINKFLYVSSIMTCLHKTT